MGQLGYWKQGVLSGRPKDFLKLKHSALAVYS